MRVWVFKRASRVWGFKSTLRVKGSDFGVRSHSPMEPESLAGVLVFMNKGADGPRLVTACSLTVTACGLAVTACSLTVTACG